MTIRRALTAVAPIALGAMLMTATASATTISVTMSVFGDVPTFTLGPTGTGTTSVAKFDPTAVNLAIQAACPSGHICGPLTLNSIDFAITTNADVVVNVTNTSGGVGFITPIGGSGTTAITAGGTVFASDSITTNLEIAAPVLAVASDTFRKSVACSTGSPALVKCLSIGTGGATFTGTGNDTGFGGYSSAGTNWSSVLALYVGSDTVNLNLTSATAFTTGTLNFAGGGSSSAVLQALTGGQEVDYNYTYTDTDVSGVPEPSTMALVGAALVAAGFIRRRATR